MAAAFSAEVQAFYEASAHPGSPLGPLAHRLAPGSPAADDVEGFLAAQAAEHVAGPASWRLGDVRVVRLDGRLAEVTACTYDAGSHDLAGGGPAPVSLGGGAGLTAYDSELIEVGTTWLVERTATSTPASSRALGPCHGFAAG